MKTLHYFDHASTTPVDRRVFAKMRPYFSRRFGNPNNLDQLGREARRAVEAARAQIAAALHCSPEEFIFTASATAADNLALVRTARASRTRSGRSGLPAGRPGKIIISAVEHKSVALAAKSLTADGFKIEILPVDKFGRVRPADLAARLDAETILVSVTMADSETGTLQPIRELARVIRNFRQAPSPKLQTSPYPHFHTDATQAALYCDLDVRRLGVDLLTLSAHKMYGPKGAAGLFVRSGLTLGRPAGTENVPAIVGFGEALRLAGRERVRESARLARLRDRLEREIRRAVPKVLLNGDSRRRLPNFSNLTFLDVEGEALLLHLDRRGIVANTGSACNSQSLEPSAVLAALGRPYEFIHGSLRFSLGRETTAESVAHLLKVLPEAVAALRRISPLRLDPRQTAPLAAPRAFTGGRTPHFLRARVKS